MCRESSRRDEGSAVVEFTLVAIVVTFVVLGVVQLAVALHVRNTLVSAAAEGARVAALPESNADAGERRAAEIIGAALGAVDAEITVTQSVLEGAPVVTVSIAAPVPLIGLWGVGEMQVDGRAYVEVSRD